MLNPIELENVHLDKLNSNFSSIFQKSWQRSQSFHIDPERKKGTIKVERFRKSVIEHAELIETSLPLMNELYQLVEGSGFVVILCDQDGLLLKMIGDKEPLKQAKEISFVEGADWSEEEVGTNAIGTCIKEKVPLQLGASDHYSKICQKWTCSATPIFGTNGSLIGVLNMSGPVDKVHPHTLGMVVSAAKAVESLMKLQEKSRKNELMKSYLEETMNALTLGILLINREGHIIQANKSIQKMLQVDEEDLLNKKVHELFGNKVFTEDISPLDCIKDKDIRLKNKINDSMKHVLLNSKPVFQENHKIGYVLTFQEIQNVRKLVNVFSGHRAKTTFHDIIGEHPLFRKSVDQAHSAANSISNVLLLGESGTGKDLFAQSIHNASDRSSMPFIAINCGAIPRDLLGSELFGYGDGAFTGAKKGGYSGKFELAEGGTIFLDEIGEMSLDMQVLLLRVLQNKEIVRIGENKVIPVDVRIIAATNKNLKEEVRKGNFREDLYYRLNVLPIRIPSLRERKNDIPFLVNYFVNAFKGKMPSKITGVLPDYIQALKNYDWPGNVRELQNILERSINQCSSEFLGVDSLPEEIRGDIHDKPEPSVKKEDAQRNMLFETIQECNYNHSKAAKKLGISRSTLYRWLEKYNLK